MAYFRHEVKDALRKRGQSMFMENIVNLEEARWSL